MSEERVAYEIVPAPQVSLGVLVTSGPADVIAQASSIATELAKIVDSRKLFTVIRGKRHVHVEGWTTLGAMLGVLPREVSVIEHENGDYEAVVELIRTSDGAIIGRGSALCGCDELDSRGKTTWGDRPRYARRSMAITRATGKAFRLALSWIMALAGYEPTPAEEMDSIHVGTMDGIIDAKATPAPASPSPEPVRTPAGTANGSKPLPRAVVGTRKWQDASASLAAASEYYRNGQGQPDRPKMLTVAAQLGYRIVEDENLEQVMRELLDYSAVPPEEKQK